MTQDNDHPAGTDHELGVLLARAARPTTEATVEVRDRLAGMAAAIVSKSQVRSRRRVGLISVVVAPILVLGAAGAAYAVKTIDWRLPAPGPASMARISRTRVWRSSYIQL